MLTYADRAVMKQPTELLQPAEGGTTRLGKQLGTIAIHISVHIAVNVEYRHSVHLARDWSQIALCQLSALLHSVLVV